MVMGIRTFRSPVFSLPGTKVPSGNLRSQERMFPGTFVHAIVSSHSDHGKDAGTAVKVKRKNIVK